MKPATPQCHSQSAGAGETVSSTAAWTFRQIHSSIQAKHKKKPLNADTNWQTPAKIRPALREPHPEIEKFSVTHAHARSRLNGRSDERDIAQSMKVRFNRRRAQDDQRPNAKRQPDHAARRHARQHGDNGRGHGKFITSQRLHFNRSHQNQHR
jgi:hypothetical protein